MDNQYNSRSPAVKRLFREARELMDDRSAEYFAQPLDDNLFEWHFTVRGPPDSEFASGVYHGRIILPTEYPMKPPSIIMLTPNGRFEINKKICLSISGHHPESWQPSWSIRTALLAIIGFMPTEGMGAIGSLDYPPEERKALAVKSESWCCPSCGQISKLLKTQDPNPTESDANKEAKELAKQICFKGTSTESSQDNTETSTATVDNNTTDITDTNNDEPPVDPNSEQQSSETVLIRRNISQTHSGPMLTASANLTINVNLNSTSASSRFTTYLIIVICIAIALLLFRRLFLL
ncbi:ubiquitin-conjugating enzyme E2 J1-like [Oppia nitens]|uniref:ubiquitin-conjugating enzyme E2 J1-like n=1 Tax=Oppia nitens TaxID=1686743 RepID=UPI0023DA81E1|nr:ubiquitin-conjugating enzyme E2 J1-like [Oppia nitens]